MLDSNGRFHIPPKKRLKDPEDVLSSTYRGGHSGKVAARLNKITASSEGRARRQVKTKRRCIDNEYDGYEPQTSEVGQTINARLNTTTDDPVETSFRATKRVKKQACWGNSMYGDTHGMHDAGHDAYDEMHSQSQRVTMGHFKRNDASGLAFTPCGNSQYSSRRTAQPINEGMDIMAMLLNEGVYSSSVNDLRAQDSRELVRQVATATLAKNAVAAQGKGTRCSIVLKSASKLYNSAPAKGSQASHMSVALKAAKSLEGSSNDDKSVVQEDCILPKESCNNFTSGDAKNIKVITSESLPPCDVPACGELVSEVELGRDPETACRAFSTIDSSHTIESQQEMCLNGENPDTRLLSGKHSVEKSFAMNQKGPLSHKTVDLLSTNTVASEGKDVISGNNLPDHTSAVPAVDPALRPKKGASRRQWKLKIRDIGDVDEKAAGALSEQCGAASSNLKGVTGMGCSSSVAGGDVCISDSYVTSLVPWVPESDFFLAILLQLKFCRLNTPIPSKILDPLTDLHNDYGDIIITGSLDEHLFDLECCDSDVSELQGAQGQLETASTAFLWKCHLTYNAEGVPCWCCCYFDFFGTFVQKMFSLDVFDFEVAQEMAMRCRQNAEVVFHMLWIQQNRDSLDCNIPQDITLAIADRFVQLHHILMCFDRFSPLTEEIGELVNACMY